MYPVPTRMFTPRAKIAVFLLFCVLTAVVTFPQVASLSTAVADHPDPYFSIWRLGWVAHALATSPSRLFEANIFHPEAGTFAYSDAMLLPGTVLAPLFWAGIPPVAIYNLALLGALALSGFTTALLARTLTGSTPAAIAAGMIYAFAPYRMEQYIHLEMEMVFWVPLVLLCVHRLMAGRRVTDAALLGLSMAAQALSGMYGALYLFVCLVVFVPALALAVRLRGTSRVALRFAGGIALAALLLLPYGVVYTRASRAAGDRGTSEIQHYGASARNYLASTPSNRLYGWTSARLGGEELNLFPGLIAAGLAAAGLGVSLTRRARVPLAYAALLVVALEAARGLDGVIYPVLYDHVGPLRGLRVPARFDLYVNLSLAVLAAYGLAALLARFTGRARQTIAAAAVALLTLEYATAPALANVPPASLADRWLTTQAPGVVVQLPMPREDAFWPNDESRQMYLAMPHWLPMLNGYSGYFPPSYLETLRAMASFPDERSIAHLRSRGVTYVVVRGQFYTGRDWDALREKLAATPALVFAAGFPPPGNDLIFRLAP